MKIGIALPVVMGLRVFPSKSWMGFGDVVGWVKCFKRPACIGLYNWWGA